MFAPVPALSEFMCSHGSLLRQEITHRAVALTQAGCKEGDFGFGYSGMREFLGGIS